MWFFIHVDCNTFISLYKALVRPHVEDANSVWSPYKKCDIEQIEKIQRRATKLVISLKKLPYKERLIYLVIYLVWPHQERISMDVQLMWPGGPVRSNVILEEAHLLLSYHVKFPFK